MNKIKIAQIGVGYWGPNLLRNMVANKSCEVRTVVDLSKERRHFVQHLYPSVRVSNGVEDIEYARLTSFPPIFACKNTN